MAAVARANTLRVLRVIARMNVGGPALQVVALTEGLGGPRFDSRLLIGSVETGEADYLKLRAPHVQATVIRGLGRAPRPHDDVVALARLAAEVRRFRPHIVHTHTAKAGVLGRVAAAVGRVPATVHTFHGHLLDGYFSPPVLRMVVQAERILARSTDRLVAVGARVRDDLVAAGIGTPDKFTVVAPGIELPPAPSRSRARQLLGLPPAGPVVGFVARLTAIKRPDRFVEVAVALAGTDPTVQFVVAGEGGLLAETRRQAAPLGANVHFLGWRGDVETVYAACDVVVLTSDNEGMPVSLIEAAFCGTPAVTTDVGSAREVVVDGETGYVTDKDVAQLVDAVARLLAEPSARERMGARAAERARLRFTSARLVADTAALYEGLAEELNLG